MTKLNIIEYLISKDKLSNIKGLTNKDIVKTQKQLKKQKYKKYQAQYRLINRDKLYQIRQNKKLKDPDLFKLKRKQTYLRHQKKERKNALARYYENKEEVLARAWLYKFKTFKLVITRKLLIYSLYFILNKFI